MALDFLNGFDGRDPRLQRFILNRGTNEKDTLQLDAHSMMAGMGFLEHGQRPEPDAMNVRIDHACRLQCELVEGIGQASLGRFTVVVPASTILEVDPSTKLGVRAGIDRGHVQAIVDAFQQYAAATDGPLPAYVATVASTTGASPFDAGLFLENQCTLVTREFDQKALDTWSGEYFQQREQKRNYRIVGIDWLADFPAPSESPNRIEGPIANGEESVKKAFEDLRNSSESCKGIVTDIPPIKVDRADMPDQLKIEWEWAYNQLPCGGGFHFWRPRTYRRGQEAVLYVTGAYPGNLEGVKSKIIEFMQDSAKEAAFYALVSFDINQAISIFKAAFTARCKAFFSNVEKCVFAEIYVVTEATEKDWHL